MDWAPDGKHLAAITDTDCLIIRVSSNGRSELIFESATCKAKPQSVCGVLWNPYKRCLQGGGDLAQPAALALVTFGVRHMLFWRYCWNRKTYVAGVQIYESSSPMQLCHDGIWKITRLSLRSLCIKLATLYMCVKTMRPVVYPRCLCVW